MSRDLWKIIYELTDTTSYLVLCFIVSNSSQWNITSNFAWHNPGLCFLCKNFLYWCTLYWCSIGSKFPIPMCFVSLVGDERCRLITSKTWTIECNEESVHLGSTKEVQQSTYRYVWSSSRTSGSCAYYSHMELPSANVSVAIDWGSCRRYHTFRILH